MAIDPGTVTFGTARNPAAVLVGRAERGLDRLFGPASNPLRHLGALGFLLFWVIAVTGGWLYAVFDTSVAGAWQSTADLATDLLGIGGVVRALHRYASDAFVVVMLAHLLRELAMGRVSGFRRFTWLSGVPLIWLAIASGIVGYWLVWDQTALLSATASIEWLDALGFFAEPLARNFQTAAAVNDRLFSLFVFLHIGLPLLVLAGMWIHIQRLARPDTRPTRTLTAGTLATLLVLSIAQPAPIAAQADPLVMPDAVAFDWFYLAPNALSAQWSAGALWAISISATLALVAMPWLLRTPRRAAAKVDPTNCNGCGRCFEDCPYAAITMVRSADGELAVVDTNACASCGICAGACPSATPFRRIDVLASGIDLPFDPVDAVRRRLESALAARPGAVIAFGCTHGADLRKVDAPDVATIPLECTGQLPPAFVDYALRHGARGVAVVGCPEGGCEFRLGDQWTDERLAAVREPHLRASVPRERVVRIGAGAGDEARVADAITRALGHLVPVVRHGHVEQDHHA